MQRSRRRCCSSTDAAVAPHTPHTRAQRTSCESAASNVRSHALRRHSQGGRERRELTEPAELGEVQSTEAGQMRRRHSSPQCAQLASLARSSERRAHRQKRDRPARRASRRRTLWIRDLVSRDNGCPCLLDGCKQRRMLFDECDHPGAGTGASALPRMRSRSSQWHDDRIRVRGPEGCTIAKATRGTRRSAPGARLHCPGALADATRARLREHFPNHGYEVRALRRSPEVELLLQVRGVRKRKRMPQESVVCAEHVLPIACCRASARAAIGGTRADASRPITSIRFETSLESPVRPRSVPGPIRSSHSSMRAAHRSKARPSFAAAGRKRARGAGPAVPL